MPYALRTTGALIVVVALGIALAATVAASALSALVVVMASNGRPQPRLRRIARAGQAVARQLTRGGSVALVAVVG